MNDVPVVLRPRAIRSRALRPRAAAADRAAPGGLGRALLAALLAGAAVLAALPARAQAVDAVAAQQALAGGAMAWDVRTASAALLPGAVRVNATAVQAWLDGDDVAALSAAVSAAGLNLSGDVVVYGDAGDERAQRIAERLRAVGRGRVHWLAGGLAAWQAAGLPTASQASSRLPLPQRLVALQTAGPGGPADASRRASTTFTASITPDRSARAGL